MTTAYLTELARQYRDVVGPWRVKILDVLYSDGRNQSLAALERILCLPEGLIQNWYRRYRILRRRCRRLGIPIPAEFCYPPPGIRPGEAAAVAEVAAGGRGEIRFARRDTLSPHGEIGQRKARRLELHDPVERGQKQNRHSQA